MTEHELRGGITSKMDEFVQNQVEKGLYDSRAEYIRARVRNDMEFRGELQ